MGIIEGTVEFPLSRGLDYKMNGGGVTAHCVVLQEPGMEHIKFYLRLKQMITRSQMELAKQAGEINKIQESIGDVVKPITEEVESLESGIEETHELFSLSLQASESVDIGQFIGTFEKMVCVRGAKKSVVMIDGKQAMTAALWGNLKPEDAFNMAVRWCAFFGTPSQEGRKTTSDRPLESPTELMEA